MFELSLVEPQFGRVKGASWFPLLYKKDVLVLGQGGIGSWTALLLSRIGCNLHLFDMDKYEVHNMTGQIVKNTAIGKDKTVAMVEVINEFSPTCTAVSYVQRYDEDSFTGDIVLCGFDNMAARKVAFYKWAESLLSMSTEEREKCFFQDGRLLAEQLQIFSIPGDDLDRITRYEKEYLFDDAEVQEAECTFKQTSHCAAMIASHMVGFLTNWVSNVEMENRGLPGFRQVPFMFEYLIPANLMTS